MIETASSSGMSTQLTTARALIASLTSNLSLANSTQRRRDDGGYRQGEGGGGGGGSSLEVMENAEEVAEETVYMAFWSHR